MKKPPSLVAFSFVPKTKQIKFEVTLTGLSDEQRNCFIDYRVPEIEAVRNSELETVRENLRPPVERDLHFHPYRLALAYTEDARFAGFSKV